MIFTKELVQWYLNNDRDLPWRKSSNPYCIWLSEIILQQTRVAQGMAYYYKFIDAFPTVFDLAKAEETEVLKLWQGLGYYSRARNLHFSAKYIVNELDGVFPTTYKELLKLKGVGDYTASAIASICFNENAAVVDGNVYRVLSRYLGVETAINSTKGIKEFKLLAQELIDEEQPGVYNQAIMDFGALHCKPQKPLCDVCFAQASCVAYGKNTVSVLPVKEKKIKIRKRYLNFIVVLSNSQKVMLEKRIGKGIWENLYQFPLIETEKSIDVTELIENEAYGSLVGSSEENVLSLYNAKDWVHKLSHQHLYVKFWIVKTPVEKSDSIPVSKIEEYPVPRLIHKFIEEYTFE